MQDLDYDKLKELLGHGGVKRISEEEGISTDTFRNRFKRNKSKDAEFIGRVLERANNRVAHMKAGIDKMNELTSL